MQRIQIEATFAFGCTITMSDSARDFSRFGLYQLALSESVSRLPPPFAVADKPKLRYPVPPHVDSPTVRSSYEQSEAAITAIVKYSREGDLW